MPGFDGISRKLSNELQAKFFAPKETVKNEEAKAPKETVPVAKKETKEVGDDLLDTRLFANALGFMGKTSTVNKADAADIDKLYSLAGMGTMPTAAQYSTISNAANNVSSHVDNLMATNNANRLFNDKADILDRAFANEFNLG